MESEAPKKRRTRKPKFPRMKVADGPTYAYKDGADGVVLVKRCEDGWVPLGWTDTPAKCKNVDGERVEVKS